MATLTAGFIETSSHGPENARAEKRGRNSSRRDACRDGGCLSVGGPCVGPVLALVFGHFSIGLGDLAFGAQLSISASQVRASRRQACVDEVRCTARAPALGRICAPEHRAGLRALRPVSARQPPGAAEAGANSGRLLIRLRDHGDAPVPFAAHRTGGQCRRPRGPGRDAASRGVDLLRNGLYGDFAHRLTCSGRRDAGPR